VMAGVLGRSGSRDRDGRRRERRREWRERGREIVSLWTDRECAQELTHRQALSLVSKMEAELSWSPPVSLESHRTACSGLRRARTAPRSDFGGVLVHVSQTRWRCLLDAHRSVGSIVVIAAGLTEDSGYTAVVCCVLCVVCCVLCVVCCLLCGSNSQ
jgi:hypothetical protein